MPETESVSRDSMHFESRPQTPESILTNSLYRANATIDELTVSLAKVSRAPTPDPSDSHLCCCCGSEECVNRKAWTAFQSKLESRLVLCAEVGQALLEKHEAYVRRHGSMPDLLDSDDESRLTVYSRPDTPTANKLHHDAQAETRITQLLYENSVLEKRLNAALLNSEVSESSKGALLNELEEAKEAISKLTLSQAKSTGWEVKLGSLQREKEDLQQELDSASQRGRAAESHVAALKDRCAKLQAEVSRLRGDLEQQKVSRTELSEEILRDARARLEMLQQSQLGHTIMAESAEVTQVMESLVADNEALKRDIAELQNLLAESREDVRVLREEVQEAHAHVSAAPGDSVKAIANSVRLAHKRNYSWASSFGQTPLSPSWNHDGNRSRPISTGPASVSPYEPLTPNTELRPLSPADSRAPSEKRLSAIAAPWPNRPPSTLNIDVDNASLSAKTPDTPDKKSPRRPLMLLTHSKGVQTDDINWSNLLPSSSRLHNSDDNSSMTPPGDMYSESSSLVDAQGHSTTVATLVDRTNTLYTRLSQADARTLTNRLKRQRLAGDVAHLTRTTISSILAEVNGLRAHFRSVLEDEKVVGTCTRRDLRALLTLFKEMFSELGQMRITLNDIILDPGIAVKVSELAMDPSKDSDDARGRAAARGAGLGSWMAPISKLFGGAAISAQPDPNSRLSTNPSVSSRSVSGALGSSSTVPYRPPRSVPKLGPALAATTTTVNVEFSGTGVGRSVSTALAVADIERPAVRSATPVAGPSASKAVMGIFAGAPARTTDTDPWIVISPRAQRKLRVAPSTSNVAAQRRWAGGVRLPRNVDAIVDVESVHDPGDDDDDVDHDHRHTGEDDDAIEVGTRAIPGTLLERTLRPRGLSDSSIRSTFLKDGERTDVPPRSTLYGGTGDTGENSSRQGAYPGFGTTTRASVLNALSRGMQSLRTPIAAPPHPPQPPSPPPTLSTHPSSPISTTAFSFSNSHTSHNPGPTSGTASRAVSPRRITNNILPTFASWAATQAGLDADATESFVGSVREEHSNFGHRTWQDMRGREEDI